MNISISSPHKGSDKGRKPTVTPYTLNPDPTVKTLTGVTFQAVSDDGQRVDLTLSPQAQDAISDAFSEYHDWVEENRDRLEAEAKKANEELAVNVQDQIAKLLKVAAGLGIDPMAATQDG